MIEQGDLGPRGGYLVIKEIKRVPKNMTLKTKNLKNLQRIILFN